MSPPASARFVTELGLDVVDHEGQLAVGMNLLVQQIGDDLFVRHRKHHVVIGPIAEADEGWSWRRRVIAPGRPPNLGRVDHGHAQLLATDGVHLLAHNTFDLLQHTPAQRQVGVQPGCQLANQSGPQR